MLSKCQGYLIFNWEELILINVLMDQEIAFTSSEFISNDHLETFNAKKSDVICFQFPPRCDINGMFQYQIQQFTKENNFTIDLFKYSQNNVFCIKYLRNRFHDLFLGNNIISNKLTTFVIIIQEQYCLLYDYEHLFPGH